MSSDPPEDDPNTDEESQDSEYTAETQASSPDEWGYLTSPYGSTGYGSAPSGGGYGNDSYGQENYGMFAGDGSEEISDTPFLGDNYLGSRYIGSGSIVRTGEDRSRTPSKYPVEDHREFLNTIAPRGPPTPRKRLNENIKSPPFPVTETTPDDDRFSGWDAYLFTFAEEFERLSHARDETTLARHVDTAQEGALDNIGDFVMTPRHHDESDDHYRARLKLQLRTSIGGGTVADMKEAAAAILRSEPEQIGIYEDFREEPARFRLDLQRSDLDDAGVSINEFVEVIKDVKAGGVRCFGIAYGAFTHRSLEDFELGISDPDLSYAEDYVEDPEEGITERIGGGDYSSLLFQPEPEIAF